jgi:DEAD/DEAH box helicase domain-containing protein
MTALLINEPRMTLLQSPFSDIADSRYRQIAKGLAHHEQIQDYWVEAPESPQFGAMPADMNNDLRQALGVSLLYSHQLEAWNALTGGQSVVLQTPTASGKTLSFNPAVFQALMSGDASAMYLLPLKALCNDQLATLQGINDKLSAPVKIGLMTGDATPGDRERLWNSRVKPQLVVWNPDVLHHAIYNLKKPEKYQQMRDYFRTLKFVVVDEAHTYQGVMGSHFANIRRRLEIAVEKFGGDVAGLQYVFATATVANGAEMIEKFSGRDASQFTVIDKSGAGNRGRTTLCLKPSSNMTQAAAEIVAQWFEYGITGIIFCNSRVQVKSLEGHLAKELGQGKARQIESYYGGMKERERVRVIEALQSGKAKVVISTCALEAGIDIAALDACLNLSFAGSIMSHRQQIGRAGRKSEALVIYLPSDRNSLDGYYGSEPRRLLGEPEAISFNPQYETILAGHLCCAVAESGIPEGREDEWFGEGAAKLLHKLSKEGWAHDSFDGKQAKAYPELSKYGSGWSCKGYPHMGVAIRGNDAAQVSLTNLETGQHIETMNKLTATREAHTGAIYGAYENGSMSWYQVESLNMKTLSATLAPLPDDRLSTQARTGLNVKVLDRWEQKTVDCNGRGKARLTYGWGKVTNYTSGYKLLEHHTEMVCSKHGASVPTASGGCPQCGTKMKLWKKGAEVIDEETFEYPLTSKMEVPILQIEINFDLLGSLTVYAGKLKAQYEVDYGGVEDFNLPREVLALDIAKPEFMALHSIGHQINLAFPTLVLGSAHDIDTHVAAPQESDYEPGAALVQTRLWIYDTTPGGSGATEQVYADFERFVEGAIKFASACPCKHGCPKCLSVNRCGQRNVGLNKEMGLGLLEMMARN